MHYQSDTLPAEILASAHQVEHFMARKGVARIGSLHLESGAHVKALIEAVEAGLKYAAVSKRGTLAETIDLYADWIVKSHTALGTVPK